MKRCVIALACFFFLFAVPSSPVRSKDPAPEKKAFRKAAVYVKILWPVDPKVVDNDQPVIEGWIRKQLKKGGKSSFTAATSWVRLVDKSDECTTVWDGNLGKKSCACPVDAEIIVREHGQVKILLKGWGPTRNEVVVTLKDESGSRKVAAVTQTKTDWGVPYVSILIGPPIE